MAYVLKLYKHCTVNNLMNLAYLVDYLTKEKTGRPISHFRYRLYSFGPFDEMIYPCLEGLVYDQIIKTFVNYSRNGLEYVTYVFQDVYNDMDFKNEMMPQVSIGEFYLIQDIIYSLFYYDDKELLEMAYNTRSIKNLGGKLGEAYPEGVIIGL